MTEDTTAAPAWVEKRLDDIFATVPGGPTLAAARDAYLLCLASRKAPAAPSGLLGDEFTPCRQALHNHLKPLHLSPDVTSALDSQLEGLEAEFAGDS